MKPTNDKVFFDTNILVYAHTDIDVPKQVLAQRLITENNSIISTQVLQELANTLHRKFRHTWNEVSGVLSEAATNNLVYTNMEATIIDACRIADRYGFSFYDSMIVSAAIASRCTTLYSEDLQNAQVIDGQITIRNPFK